MKKKSLTKVVAAITTATLLAGCGGAASTDTASTSSDTAAETTEAADTAETTVTPNSLSLYARLLVWNIGICVPMESQKQIKNLM